MKFKDPSEDLTFYDVFQDFIPLCCICGKEVIIPYKDPDTKKLITPLANTLDGVSFIKGLDIFLDNTLYVFCTLQGEALSNCTKLFETCLGSAKGYKIEDPDLIMRLTDELT